MTSIHSTAGVILFYILGHFLAMIAAENIKERDVLRSVCSLILCLVCFGVVAMYLLALVEAWALK